MRKTWLIGLWLGFASTLSAQIVVSNISVADAFVRSLDPTHNYGGAGALSVSGPIATNVIGQQEGLLDSFLRFDASNAIGNFNSSYGTGKWVIVRATLNLYEQGAPNNQIFNRGVGPFEVRWSANDTWAEGTGNPNAPTTDGVVWNDESTILNSHTDATLGSYTNRGVDGLVKLALGMPPPFAADLASGGLVSFYLTPTTNSAVGFTFHSHNFVDSAQWPFLEIMAVPVPQVVSLVIAGTDVRITCAPANGLTNIVEYAADLASGSWNTLTNLVGAGNNAVAIDPGAATLLKRFYRVRLSPSW